MPAEPSAVRTVLTSLRDRLTGRHHKALARRLERIERVLERLEAAGKRETKAAKRETKAADTDRRWHHDNSEQIDRRVRGLERALRRSREAMGDLQKRLAGKGVAGRLARLERDTKALLRGTYMTQAGDSGKRALSMGRFSLMSQNEEDGIVWQLLGAGVEKTRRFVEIGCGDNGGNSGFLASELGFSGLMIDGAPRRIERARVRFERPGVRCREAFVTREGINELLTQGGSTGEIDLLSIDIDGNDYWIWEAIEVCDPRLVVVEYNSLFGPDRAVAVPYAADFDRWAARDTRKGSMAYYGASLRAFDVLARRKGYRLVAVEPRGVNAFFLRDDVAPAVPEVDSQRAFRRFVKYARRGVDVYSHVEQHGLALIEVEHAGSKTVSGTPPASRPE